MDDLNALTGAVRRCVDDYAMIAPGDRIAVGVSGGKDSLVLLRALHFLRGYYPAPFTLEALTVDAGFPDMDFRGVEALCRELEIPWTRIETDIREIVFEARRESSPCALCAKMRRGALVSTAAAHGCGKLALGHHFDDAVETLLLSVLYEGRLGCFEPTTYLPDAGVTLIRPMLYVGRKRAENAAASLSLPVVKNTCPMDKTSRRREAEALLNALSAAHPDARSKLFGAMQRLPLPGWEKKK